MHQIDDAARFTIPELWMREWIEIGHEQSTDYLEKHDAYLAYCAEHGLEP